MSDGPTSATAATARTTALRISVSRRATAGSGTKLIVQHPHSASSGDAAIRSVKAPTSDQRQRRADPRAGEDQAGGRQLERRDDPQRRPGRTPAIAHGANPR